MEIYIILGMVIVYLAALLALMVVTNRDLERTMSLMRRDHEIELKRKDSIHELDLSYEKARAKATLEPAPSNFGRNPVNFTQPITRDFRSRSENSVASSTPPLASFHHSMLATPAPFAGLPVNSTLGAALLYSVASSASGADSTSGGTASPSSSSSCDSSPSSSSSGSSSPSSSSGDY